MVREFLGTRLWLISREPSQTQITSAFRTTVLKERYKSEAIEDRLIKVRNFDIYSFVVYISLFRISIIVFLFFCWFVNQSNVIKPCLHSHKQKSRRQPLNS